MGSGQAQQQPGPGAGISQVQHLPRRQQTANAKPVDPPDTIGAAFNFGTIGTQGLGRGQHVLPLQQTVNNGFSNAQSAQD